MNDTHNKTKIQKFETYSCCYENQQKKVILIVTDNEDSPRKMTNNIPTSCGKLAKLSRMSF